ncbi:MAG: type II toxin-antitoxin system VapC family toxin [Blastocatellia bacterium]
MTRITFDTSVIIAYKMTEAPKNFVLSAPVISELISGASDDSERKGYEASRRDHEKKGALIVPTSEDWLFASRILFWLTRRRKKQAGGQTPPLKVGASQRMMMDALIAVSARREDVVVVTEDWDDYKAIQYYCKVKLKHGGDYFRQSESDQ